MEQLDIFSLPIAETPIKELPRAITVCDQKVEEAFLVLVELKAMEVAPLVEGCTVRSSTSFKEQTGKLLRFETIANVEFAIVQFEFRGSPIQYPCTIKTLEVIA